MAAHKKIYVKMPHMMVTYPNRTLEMISAITGCPETRVGVIALRQSGHAVIEKSRALSMQSW